MNTRFKENVQKLFEYWCEISPTAIGEKVSGVIVESFPDKFKDPEIIKKIPEFAYPCQFLNESVQTYSFVLTSTDSKWRFGFCRHDAKTQTAMVLITYLPWHDTFLKFLNVLGELKRTAQDEFQPFLAEAYSKGVPGPGACLKLFYNAGLNNFIFQRPEQFQLPSIPENHNLNLYYNFVDPKNMIAVFAAMLAERRIIFTSQRLDRLSSCVQAANAFLYPMVWQHIFIPILPLKMKEILCAPMPYLIGVPEAVLETMTREELGEVVILNCDNKYIETPFDDVKKMPPDLVSQLKKQLNNQNDHMGDRVSKIFLGVLVQLIGGYRDAIRYRHGERITWCPDTFIETRPSHLRPFLRHMLQLQIFQQFIEERLEMLNTGLGFSDEFELETERYHEKSTKRGKTWKIVTTVKDKTNPAVKSAVQSVKQGGRGMKTVYKDFKSKISDRTPPKHSNRTSSMASATVTTSIGLHHSAPNSPVFSKRPQSDFISISNSSTHRNKSQKMLQTSNSMINNSNLTNHFNNNITINMNTNQKNQISCMNHDANQTTPIATQTTTSAMPINGKHLNSQTISKSPIAIGSSSPTSSISSTSEMNILQELQQHALFKISTVDRHELDVNDSSASNSSSSFETPFDQLPPVPPRITNPPPRNRRVSDSLIIIDSDEKQNQSKQQQQQQQPKQIHQQQSLNENNNLRISAPLPIVTRSKPKPIISPSMQTASTPQSFANIRMAFENNFVQKSNSKSNSNTNSNSFNSIKQSNGIKSTVHRSQPFIEPPPSSTKQSNQLNNDHKMPEEKLDSTNDLIELDASTSFEIDDFDPLNLNAKQLPIVQSKGGAPSIVLSQMPSTASAPNANPPVAGIQAFSNPVYPFHSPSQLPPKPQSSAIVSSTSTSTPSTTTTTITNNKIDDELELLRKYGLDRFKIVDTNRSNQCNGIANDIKFNQISNNNNNHHHSANDSMFQNSQRTWTTFE